MFGYRKLLHGGATGGRVALWAPPSGRVDELEARFRTEVTEKAKPRREAEKQNVALRARRYRWLCLLGDLRAELGLLCFAACSPDRPLEAPS
jgi:hypothetical protein